jgi:hypothetical protein
LDGWVGRDGRVFHSLGHFSHPSCSAFGRDANVSPLEAFFPSDFSIGRNGCSGELVEALVGEFNPC